MPAGRLPGNPSGTREIAAPCPIVDCHHCRACGGSLPLPGVCDACRWQAEDLGWTVKELIEAAKHDRAGGGGAEGYDAVHTEIGRRWLAVKR